MADDLHKVNGICGRLWKIPYACDMINTLSFGMDKIDAYNDTHARVNIQSMYTSSIYGLRLWICKNSLPIYYDIVYMSWQVYMGYNFQADIVL